MSRKTAWLTTQADHQAEAVKRRIGKHNHQLWPLLTRLLVGGGGNSHSHWLEKCKLSFVSFFYFKLLFVCFLFHSSFHLLIFLTLNREPIGKVSIYSGTCISLSFQNFYSTSRPVCEKLQYSMSSPNTIRNSLSLLLVPSSLNNNFPSNNRRHAAFIFIVPQTFKQFCTVSIASPAKGGFVVVISLLPRTLNKSYVYHTLSILWRCPWCRRYRRRKWTRRHEFKSWTRLIAFHIALIPLGKVWIQLFSLQLWVNSRTDWILQPWWGN